MRALGVEPTLEIAEALYVGLVTDTGKFMYENTGLAGARHGGRAHRRRASTSHGIYRRLYEDMPYAKLELLARALAPVRALRRRAADLDALTRDDFAHSGAEDSYSEGIIDHLRSVDGTKVAALARELARGQPRGAQGVAARHRRPGRRLGHRPRRRRRRPSAGRRVRHRDVRGRARRLPARAGRRAAPQCRGGLVLVDKPPGKTSHDLTLATRRLLGVRKVGHAGTLDPFATGLLLVLVGRARRAQRFLMALPKQYVTVARLGALSTTGDPEGEIAHTGRVPAGRRGPADRGHRAAPADLLGRARPGPQGLRARPRRRGSSRCPSARSPSTASSSSGARGTAPQFLIECSAGTYVRSLDRRAGRRLLRGAAPHRASGRSRVEDADPQRVLPLEQALAFLPARRDRRRRRVARRPRPGDPRRGPTREHVLLADADGPVAIAEPREDGRLKPVVGFRG